MKLKDYPPLVRKLVEACDAWIIGSSVLEAEPRDYDVYVPTVKWREACAIIPGDAKVNTFGGFKCLSAGKEVDVWTCDMHALLSTVAFNIAWHPRSGVKIRREFGDVS